MNSRLSTRACAICGLRAVVAIITGCTYQPGATSSTVPITPLANPTSVTTVSTSVPATAGSQWTATLFVDLQSLKTDMARIAADFARQIDSVAVIAAVSAGPNSAAFLSLVQHLKVLMSGDSRIAYAYLVEQQNDTVRFLATANHCMPDDAPFISL